MGAFVPLPAQIHTHTYTPTHSHSPFPFPYCLAIPFVPTPHCPPLPHSILSVVGIFPFCYGVFLRWRLIHPSPALRLRARAFGSSIFTSFFILLLLLSFLQMLLLFGLPIPPLAVVDSSSANPSPLHLMVNGCGGEGGRGRVLGRECAFTFFFIFSSCFSLDP